MPSQLLMSSFVTRLVPWSSNREKFTDSVKNLLHIDKKAIVVVHQKLKHRLIDEFRNKSDLLIELDLNNREYANDLLLDKCLY